MTGKWNAMWHSGSVSVPKYSTTSFGHWLASASRMRPGYSSSTSAADLPDEVVRLRQVLAVRPLTLEQVGDRVEPDAVDAEVHPEPQDVDDRVLHGRVVEVQVGLVAEEPVPVVLAADRVERPVARLGVDEDDPGVLYLSSVSHHT